MSRFRFVRLVFAGLIAGIVGFPGISLAKLGFSGNVSLEGGGMETAIGSIGLRYGADNFALRFAAEHKQTGGHENRDPWDPDDEGWRLSETELNHISLGGDLWLGESLLRVDFDNFRRDRLSGTRTQWDVPRETNKYQISWEMPLWRFGEETVFSIQSYYFDDESTRTGYRINLATMEFDIFVRTTHRAISNYRIMPQVSTRLGVLGNHHLVVGIDFSRANVEHRRKFPGGKARKFNGVQSLWALFVNNEIHLGERVILIAGLRYDRWKNRDGRFYDHKLGRWKEFPIVTDSAISPRGEIVYKLTETARLRASFDTGFRAPTLVHKFWSGHDVVGRYNLGNPELRSERLDWSYDIGLGMQPHENFNLSLTFYRSRLSDFWGRSPLAWDDPRIPFWANPGHRRIWQTINIGEADIHGLEAELDFRFNEKWSVFVNHTFNVSKVRKHKKDPDVEGNYLPWSPRHTSVVSFTYDNPRLFTLNLSIEKRGSRFTRLDNKREVAGYQLVNMRVSREIFENLDVFANVENLTDERRMLDPCIIAPPFNAMVGMRYTF